MPYSEVQQGLFKDVWITAGIFSNHHLLERLQCPSKGVVKIRVFFGYNLSKGGNKDVS